MINSKIKGWTKNSEDKVSHLYHPHTSWKRLDENFIRLGSQYDLPLAELQSIGERVRSQFALEPIIIDPERNKKRRTYRGIGLTSRPNSKDPIYEAAQYFNEDGEFVSSAKGLDEKDFSNDGLSSQFEKQFTEVNEVAPDLVKRLKDKFKSQITKVRMMELAPSGVIAPHFDHPYYEQIRVHAVIDTNSDVYWEVEGQIFQIPADGSFYWFDTGKIHSVYNLGKTPRLVLSLHLIPNLNSAVGNKLGIADLIRQNII